MLLKVQGLKTYFPIGGSWRPGAEKKVLKAVDGISFGIREGEVLSLVGESGCGKSTVGRTLTRLETASGGEAVLQGQNLLEMPRSQFKPLRRHIQMIFQDPFASLNPRLTIEQTLREPLMIHGLAKSKSEARQKIAGILSEVGLDPKMMNLHPHEFSGGQRQRIGIARVMIVSPSLIIADEPVSALDVSIQAQVLNLIKTLQKEHGVAMLFISHDLGVVRHVSDRVAVMYLGRIVEAAKKAELFNNPRHPYTRLLLASIPRADPTRPRPAVEMTGEPASATHPPPGCSFHPRCPLATDICRTSTPSTTPVSKDHSIACHHADSTNKAQTV